MRVRRIASHMFVLCVVGFGLLIALPSVGQAVQIVSAGFDLFMTSPPASFNFNTVPNPQIVDFEGNPIGCFDFGSGCVGTGLTDTIVERLSDADLGGV